MKRRPRVPPTLSAPQAEVAGILGPLDGKRIPGGCGSCDAYQCIEPVIAGVWRVAIYHDEDCPLLARYRSQAA